MDAHGRWMFEGREVTHPGVLAYFKGHLHLEDSYYILNRHGEKVEKAYLDGVQGFPLFALSAGLTQNRLTFILDTGENVEIDRSCLFVSVPDVLFFFHPERGVPVRLKASAMMHAMEFMNETDGRLRWTDGVLLQERAAPFGPGRGSNSAGN